MKENLISVIVPVYKVELYLKKCVDSLLNQTYKNLEIILVDDGSPDNCPKICDEYAKKDNRIKVIHKKNGGLSSARNAGLDIAKGDYIAFVDSDDYVHSDYINKLYNQVKKDGSSLAICGVQIVNENGTNLDSSKFDIKSKFIPEVEKFNLLFLENSISPIVAWNKLYSAEIWKDLRYPNGKIHEDEFVIFDVLNNAKNGVSVLSEKLYYYLVRENSIMGSKTPKPAMLDLYYATKYRLSRMSENSVYFKRAVLQNYFSIFIVYKRVKKDKSLVKKLKAEVKQDYKKYKKHLSLKHKIKLSLFLYFPFLLK